MDGHGNKRQILCISKPVSLDYTKYKNIWGFI